MSEIVFEKKFRLPTFILDLRVVIDNAEMVSVVSMTPQRIIKHLRDFKRTLRDRIFF
jgi:hypothetical protein